MKKRTGFPVRFSYSFHFSAIVSIEILFIARSGSYYNTFWPYCDIRPAVGAHPCARQCSVALRRFETDVATGPAARCPPVCRGTTFPLRRNGKIIPHRADGRKGGSALEFTHFLAPADDTGTPTARKWRFTTVSLPPRTRQPHAGKGVSHRVTETQSMGGLIWGA